MCSQCVAQGAAYVVPGLAALRIWSRRRTTSMRLRPGGEAAQSSEPSVQRPLSEKC